MTRRARSLDPMDPDVGYPTCDLCNREADAGALCSQCAEEALCVCGVPGGCHGCRAEDHATEAADRQRKEGW